MSAEKKREAGLQRAAEAAREGVSELTEKQYFYAAEFEAEEAWLSFMQREGWKFAGTDGWKYRFLPCEPEDWVYHLDFKEETGEDEDYVQMYRDYGWECVTQYGHWFYFRKKRVPGREEDFSIFSDNRSKMEMIERVIQGMVRRSIPLYLLLMGGEFLVWGTPLLKGNEIAAIVLEIAAILLLLAVVFGFGIYIGQLDRLQKLRAKLDTKA